MRIADWSRGTILHIAASVALIAWTASAEAQRGRGGGYANCAAVRAAGAAPIRRGEPGYAAHLDRDGDGIACELTRNGGGGRSGARGRRRR
jgi:hypothetical protein